MSNYMYNNVELPEIPNWDRTTYPYAVLSTNNWFSRLYCTMYLLKSVDYTTNDEGFRALDCTTDLCYFVSYPPDEPATEWSEIITDKSELLSFGAIKWSNFDLLNEDGSIYLPASDPVPIEPEPEQPTLTARDLYCKINGKSTKLTLYKKINGELKQIQLNEGDIT